jgi:hypothetical protein
MKYLFMKAALYIVITLIVVSGVFLFTKPSDEACRNAAMKIVNGDLPKVPGYSDPNAANSLPVFAQPDKLLISDRFLWKDISYVYPSTVKKIGKGYLGSFHALSAKEQ